MSEKTACACGTSPKTGLSLLWQCRCGGIGGFIRPTNIPHRRRQNVMSGRHRRAGVGLPDIHGKRREGLAIDGCPLNCAEKTLELAGFTQIEHLCLTDLGFQKGSSPATPANVDEVAQAAAAKLAD